MTSPSNITFHPAIPYQLPDNATLTAITVASNGMVILVTQVLTRDGIDPAYEFRCTVGTCANGVVAFDYTPTSFYQFKGGASGIAVAMDDNDRVVFVFSQNGNLWYVTGTLDGNAITWNDSVQFDGGDTPSVAISNAGTVIEAHRDTNNVSDVYHHFGFWNGATIDGFDGKGKGVSGIQVGSLSSVSAALNADGEVVVGYSGGAYTMPSAWSINGTVQDTEIHWHYLGARNYDTGEYAQIAIDAEGDVVATFVPVGGFDPPYIHYRTGEITANAKSIDFDDPGMYEVNVGSLDAAMSPAGNYLVLFYDAEGLTLIMYADLP